MITTIGAAVTSWNTDIASASRPWRAWSSSCAASCLPITVVDDCLREGRAERECGRAGQSGEPRRRADQRGRRQHLSAAQAEDQVPQCIDLRQREVQSDGEEQEDDAEFGERANDFRIGHEPGCVWTDQRTDEHVGEARRNPAALEQRDGQHRCREQQQRFDERHRHARGAGAPAPSRTSSTSQAAVCTTCALTLPRKAASSSDLPCAAIATKSTASSTIHSSMRVGA